VVPAEERPQKRCERAEQRPVRVDAPVEADVRPVVIERGERPHSAAAQIALDLGDDPSRRSSSVIFDVV
jgi:hypothetical protein